MILLLLFLKHLIVDFYVQMQVPYMYINKGKYGHEGGILHAAQHAVGTLLVLLPFGMSAGKLVFLALLDGVIHYHMDWFKVYWCNKRDYDKNVDVEYWHWLGIDQTVHNLTYLLIGALA